MEASEQRHRPFGEAGVLGDQAFVLDQGEAGGGRGGGGALRDYPAALGGIDDDVAGLELLDIIVGAADGDDPGMMEAVADGRGAASNAGDLEVDDLLAEQGDDPLKRADPARAFGGGGSRAPAHRLGPGKGADDGGNGFGEDGAGGSAGLVDDREIDAVAFLELLAGEAGLAKEAFERLRRGGGSGALGLLADGGGLGRQAAGDEDESAGRGIGLERFGGEPGT